VPLEVARRGLAGLSAAMIMAGRLPTGNCIQISRSRPVQMSTVFELELIASLSGLTGAVLSLHNYTGFQYNYGLSFVQAF